MSTSELNTVLMPLRIINVNTIKAIEIVIHLLKVKGGCLWSNQKACSLLIRTVSLVSMEGVFQHKLVPECLHIETVVPKIIMFSNVGYSLVG